VLPTYRKMTAELAQLTPPEGDEEKVDEVVKALEKTADRIEAEPLNGDLKEVSALATAYGIPACGE
jgi:thiamine monophosphate kinase